MDVININIFNLVGNSFCVNSDDGNKVFYYIKQALEDKKKINLDFVNVSLLTSAFLNSAIGQLYRDFKDDSIKNLLQITNLSNEDKELLKRVVSTAKLFFQEPNRMQKSIDEILGEDSEKTI